MTDDKTFWQRLYYIPLAHGEKLPAWEWGGYDQDFAEADEVYTWQEARDADWDRWGYIDTVDPGTSLGIVDLDFHKDDSPWGFGDIEASERAKFGVRSQSGGLHIPFTVRADFSGEIRVAQQFKDFVDLKGILGKGHAVFPGESTGYEPVDAEGWVDEPAHIDASGERAMNEQLAKVLPSLKDGGDQLFEVKPTLDRSSLRPGMLEGSDSPGSVYQFLDRQQYPVDQRCDHPFHGSSTDSNFDVMPDAGEGFWRCWRHETSGTLLHLLGMHYGFYECGDWEYMDPSDRAMVHRLVRARAEEDGYDLAQRGRAWELDAQGLSDVVDPDHSVSPAALKRIRMGTEDLIGSLMDGHKTRSSGVVTSYPNAGKTYGFAKNLVGRDKGGTILQPNRELRTETGTMAEEEHGLDVFDLPSFPNDSPLMDEDSQFYRPDVSEWYHRGMPPRAIYNSLGDDAPDPEDDEYRRKMQAEWTDRDLCVGDPVHSFLERAVEGRHVAMDDVDPYSSFVDEYDLNDEQVRESVMGWLQHHNGFLLDRGVEIETWDDVTKPTDRARDVILDLADEHPAEGCIPETERVTAEASRVARALMLAGKKRDGRAEWVEPSPLPQGGRGTKHVGARVGDFVIVASLPLDLKNAETLLMLTATPVVPVFREIFQGLNLSSGLYDSMDADQREDYFDEVLGATVVQTTKASRFVSGGSNTRPDKLRATVREIEDLHGEEPVVVSSKKALTGQLKPVIEELDLDTINFARAVGTNAFEDCETALIWGAPHYGDDYVRRVAAFCGDTDAEPIREEGHETKWSTETSQAIYDNMTEGTVFQAMLRVGRSTDSTATIYVETDKIPDDVPRYEPKGQDLMRMLSGAERQVVEAAKGLGTFTARDIADVVDCSRRTVYDVLSRLVEDDSAEVVGRGAYGADEYSLSDALKDAADGLLPESVRSDLIDIIMAKPHNLQEHVPDLSDRDRVLTDSGGVKPLDVTVDRPDDPQMTLDEVG